MTPQNGNPHLGDTLKELNSAIEEWDKITNKPGTEQGLSKDMSKDKDSLEQRTKELLAQLRDQIHTLSQDADENEEELILEELELAESTAAPREEALEAASGLPDKSDDDLADHFAEFPIEKSTEGDTEDSTPTENPSSI